MAVERARHLSADERIGIELVVRRRVLDRDLVDIDLELFGDQHRDRGIGSLSHLDDRHHERDFAGAIDAQKRVRRERRIARETVAHLAACGQAEAQQQTAADRGGRREPEEIAARRRSEFLRFDRRGLHRHTPPPRTTPAARLMAARMRG